MATRGRQLLKRNYIFAVLILIVGFGGLLSYDLYIKPYVLSQTVVKVKATKNGFLPKNVELTREDLYLDSVQTKDIPAGAITAYEQVMHKITNVDLTDGSILTEPLVDVSDLEPQGDEGIFPIPKEAIYAINGSLRSRDKVDLYLVDADIKNVPAEELQTASPPIPATSLFLSDVTVNYVRTEDNNDVLDSEDGNVNNRFTSTGKVAVPELKLKKSDGELLGQYLEQGKQLWIVRVK